MGKDTELHLHLYFSSSIFLTLSPLLSVLWSQLGSQPLKLGHQPLPTISVTPEKSTPEKLTIVCHVKLRKTKNHPHGWYFTELRSNCMEDFQHIPLGEQTFPSPLCSKGTLITAANSHYSDSVMMNVYIRETDSKRIMCIQSEKRDPNHDLSALKRAMSWITMNHSWISCISRNSQFISLNTRIMAHICKQKNNVTHPMNNLL